MEKMLDRRTSLRIDVALYQRIHAICIEVGIPVGLFIRAAATNVDPGMLETGSKAWKTGIHSFTPVDRRETQGERRRIDLRLSDAEREIIARAVSLIRSRSMDPGVDTSTTSVEASTAAPIRSDCDGGVSMITHVDSSSGG